MAYIKAVASDCEGARETTPVKRVGGIDGSRDTSGNMGTDGEPPGPRVVLVEGAEGTGEATQT